MTILWQGQRTLVDKAHILRIVINLCLNVFPLKDIMLVCKKHLKTPHAPGVAMITQLNLMK